LDLGGICCYIAVVCLLSSGFI